jgi:hypothetical protein
MGQINMSNLGSKKGEVPAAPRVLKLLAFGLIFNFEQLLLKKHFKIRPSSGYTDFQTFTTFYNKIY